MEEHVTRYFNLGLSNAEILAFLDLAHLIVISKSTLKHTLRRLKLRRKQVHGDLPDVAMIITKEHYNEISPVVLKKIFKGCQSLLSLL